MKRRILILAAVLLTVFNGVVGVHIFSAQASESSEDSAYRNITVLTRALQLIRQDYVDENKVGYRELTYSALRGLLSGLDPHSQFLEPKDFQSMQEDTRGDFGGIGVVVSTRNGVLTVVSPMEGTPGAEAGLLPGDQIIKINGTTTEKVEESEAIGTLRGEPGQSVLITILRPATNEILDFDIVRAVIPVSSVKETSMLPEEQTGGIKMGYVRLNQFSQPTADELKEALDRLTKEGMEAFILDLRHNPGGLLNSAKDVCAEFLKPNQMVVYTEGRVPSQRRTYRTPANYTPRPWFPMVVLINNGSASGSEIVAGALKDLDRAIIVGETSFGKGSVQSVMQLPDGSAVKLTTAKYFTPSREMIHEKGVTPHIRVTLNSEQEQDVITRRREDLLPEDRDGLADPQLDRAVDALRGWVQYASQHTSDPTITTASALKRSLSN